MNSSQPEGVTDKYSLINMSQHSYLEPFICSEERCISQQVNDAAMINFDHLPMDILKHASGKH